MKRLSKISLILSVAIVLVLVVATIVDKFEGHGFATEKIYTSWWMIMLWGMLSFFSLAVILMRKMWKRPAVFLLHIGFIVVLGGALLTHCLGWSGTLHLFDGETSNIVVMPDKSIRNLDFNVRLDSFAVQCYKGTDTPSDYSSLLSFIDYRGHVKESALVSVNNICDYEGYRFFQSSFDSDMQGTVLTVSNDLWGRRVIYLGYGMLLLGMLLFFFDRNSLFRKALRDIRSSVYVCLVFLLLPIGVDASELKSASKEVSVEFGKTFVLYQGRVCPVSTLALDLCRKLYKSDCYNGFAAEQVLLGWVAFPESWHADLQLDSSKPKDRQKAEIIDFLSSGEMLKVFPVKKGGGMQWQGCTGMSDSMATQQSRFVNGLKNSIRNQNDVEAMGLIKQLREYQSSEAGEVLPSESLLQLELFYNKVIITKPLAMMCLALGIIGLVLSIVFLLKNIILPRWLSFGLILVGFLVSVYLLLVLILRWIVLGSVPLTNGYEAMLFMALVVIVLSMMLRRKFALFMPIGLLVTGFALLVALLGESDPPVIPVMPVLSSPLLCIHVMIIMLAYALLAIICMFSVSALFLMHRHSGRMTKLTSFTVLLHTLAVFLLTIGIFVGAVWANVSWGSYWQWDPKETWALITLLVYSVPLHRFSIKMSPIFFHMYLVVAFLCVLITYFGVNYFLGGMHSYA